jgi:hypothetical protein
MPRYQGARWRPIPENSRQAPITATQVILHVSASEATSLYGWWNQPGNELESHFHVARDGSAEQYLDTAVMADANYLANRRADGTGAISIETQGGDANGTWDPRQVSRIIDIIRWAHQVHGVPLRLCRTPVDPGIGWHVMWGSPGAWTPVTKVCPGPNRIRQVQETIMPLLVPRNEEVVMDAELDRRLAGIEAAQAAQTRSLGVIGRILDDTQRRMLTWRPRDEAAQTADAERDAKLDGRMQALNDEVTAALAALGQAVPPTPPTGGTP